MKNNFSENLTIHHGLMKFQNVLAILLILSGLSVRAQDVQLDEAVCKPRPTAVPVSDNHEYIPYHVVLYRCSGTVEKTSPSYKTCSEIEFDNVPLKVKDKKHDIEKTITVKNHTRCGSTCTPKCNEENMIHNRESCRCECLPGRKCLKLPPNGPDILKSGRNDNKTIPTAYLIGMAFVGFFAIFVLLFDATLCARKQGFMFNSKHYCCGGKRHRNMNTENQLQNCQSGSIVANGKAFHTMV